MQSKRTKCAKNIKIFFCLQSHPFGLYAKIAVKFKPNVSSWVPFLVSSVQTDTHRAWSWFRKRLVSMIKPNQSSTKGTQNALGLGGGNHQKSCQSFDFCRANCYPSFTIPTQAGGVGNSPPSFSVARKRQQRFNPWYLDNGKLRRKSSEYS